MNKPSEFPERMNLIECVQGMIAGTIECYLAFDMDECKTEKSSVRSAGSSSRLIGHNNLRPLAEASLFAEKRNS